VVDTPIQLLHMKLKFPTGIDHIEYKKVKPFWTKREYEYQQLIINGFAVQREPLPTAQIRRGEDAIPKARIDIYYDTGGEGVGTKKISGGEAFVYKEATQFLDPGELSVLNIKWKKAYSLGYFDYKDPKCKKDLYTDDLPPWISFDKDGQVIDKKDWNNPSWNKSFKKDYPLRDLFLTQKIDANDVVEKKDLSTFYKHIRGDLELTKRKAMEYGSTINLAPASLMFEPMRVLVWGNVNLIHNVTITTDTENVFPEIHTPGSVYIPLTFEQTICPAELYRVDIKCIRVRSRESIYDGFIAYYYETNSISKEPVHNKLCMIRELKDKNHKYYLGIYQIYGNKIRILNPDPSADQKIIAEDVNPDLVAPIISFTKPAALEADKILSTNLKETQKLGELVREEHAKRITIAQEKIKLQARIKNIAEQVGKAKKESEKELVKHTQAVKEMEMKKKELFDYINDHFYKLSLKQEKRGEVSKSFLGELYSNDDDFVVPEFLKEDEKKRA